MGVILRAFMINRITVHWTPVGFHGSSLRVYKKPVLVYKKPSSSCEVSKKNIKFYLRYLVQVFQCIMAYQFVSFISYNFALSVCKQKVEKLLNEQVQQRCLETADLEFMPRVWELLQKSKYRWRPKFLCELMELFQNMKKSH